MKKMVIVKQRDIKDCGACALSSVIQYYGGFVPLEKIRRDTCTTIEGTSAYHLMNSAIKYGFDCIGATTDITHIKKRSIRLPAILHFRYQNGLTHFVVLYEIKKNHVILMDPAKGKVKMSLEELEQVWTKHILVFNYCHKIAFEDKPSHIFHLLYRLMPYDKTLYIKLICSSIFLTFFSILSNFFLKTGINNISNHHDKHYLIIIILLFFIFVLFKVIFQFLRNYFETYINKNVDIYLLFPFLKHLFSLPLSIVKSRSSGEIITRVGELLNIKDLFSEIFVTIFLDVLLAMTSMIFLYQINRTLFFTLCLIVLLYLIWALVIHPLLYRKIKDQMESEANFQSEIITDIEGISSIKNLQLESFIANRVEERTVDYIKKDFHFRKLVLKEQTGKNFIYEIGMFSILSIGLFLIFQEKLVLVDLLTFQSLMLYFFEPLKGMIDLLPRYSLVKASFEKISEFIALEEENLTHSEEEFLNGNIVVQDLTYSYNKYDNVLDHVSFEIKQGEHILLCGSSGCGKSTLCRLLTRLESDYTGNILIGGVSVLDYKLDTIRKNIVYVSQKENLFSGRIYENIVCDKEVSPADLTKILEICEASTFIRECPLQLNTMLTDGGFNLSGGQRQRLILARALLKDASILILDEALSEVDAKTEQKIIDHILQQFPEKTIIYITHHKNIHGFDRSIMMEGV